jgi:outer membrane receptor for ferrienterochelin and colicins
VRTDFVARDEAERRGATNVAEALQGEASLQLNSAA